MDCHICKAHCLSMQPGCVALLQFSCCLQGANVATVATVTANDSASVDACSHGIHYHQPHGNSLSTSRGLQQVYTYTSCTLFKPNVAVQTNVTIVSWSALRIFSTISLLKVLHDGGNQTAVYEFTGLMTYMPSGFHHIAITLPSHCHPTQDVDEGRAQQAPSGTGR